MKIAQVIPLTRLKKGLDYFDYLVPDKLEKQVKRGQLVEIPFRNKKIKGIVFDLAVKQASNYKLKKIATIMDPLPFLSRWQLDLIQYLADYYFISMSVLLKMMLPEIPKRQKLSDDKFLKEFHFLGHLQASKNIAQYLRPALPVFLRYYNQEDKIKIYLGLIEQVIKNKKQLAIIVPQLNDIRKIYQYLADYKDNVCVFLNNLPKNKYWQEWSKIKTGEAKIIIGTRSAIFAPFKDLGLLIIDQEDNSSHKQEEPNPRYQVKNVALKIRELTKCRLIFTSQSPSLESLYSIQQKKWRYFEIDKINSQPLIKIVDRRDELKKGNISIFSDELAKQIDYNLKRAQKVFLFLNRKGLATMVACQDCGFIADCPTCKIPLTLHANKKLICHHCDFSNDLFLSCPNCHGSNIKLSGSGTEKIEVKIKELYPLSMVLKIDKETAFNKNMPDQYDIIIGTQYAFDFIDWKEISLIGVINADTFLYLPDYKAAERTFNLLMRLANYIRSDKKELIIQTFVPDNYIFKAIKNLDYRSFYINEIQERKLLQYPPFAQLIRLIYQSVEFNNGQKEIDKIYNSLKSKIEGLPVIINPPVLAYTQQVRGKWRWQIVFKILDQKISWEFLKGLSENIIIDRDPENLL